MDPIIGAALIQGGTALIGGAAARAGVQKGAADEVRGRILAGKEFGLHPLAAIGATTSGNTGHYIGDGIARAGEAAADAVRAKSGKVLEDKQGELLDAQIAETRSRTLLNQAEARSRSALDPFAPRKENALVQLKLENGEVIYVPNPDVYEISPTELATGRTLIEGARVVQKADPLPPSPPALRNPQLGTVVEKGDLEWVYTRSGWRHRPNRNKGKRY